MTSLLLDKTGHREEGCAPLNEAIAWYARMGMPEEDGARETARRLRCVD